MGDTDEMSETSEEISARAALARVADASRAHLYTALGLALSCVLIAADARAQAPRYQVERHPIINGTRLPALSLERGELNSFAWLHPADSPQEVTCSGALITPVHVLTAAHCLEPYNFRGFGVGFGLSPLEEDSRAYTQVRRARAHPRLDLAVITLTRPPDLRVTPLGLPASGLPEDALAQVEVMGYGERRDPERPAGRYFLTLEVIDVEPDFIRAAPLDPESGVCFGDSGGPDLALLPADEVTLLARELEGVDSARPAVDDDGEAEVDAEAEAALERAVSIVGVESVGSSSCRGEERLPSGRTVLRRSRALHLPLWARREQRLPSR